MLRPYMQRYTSENKNFEHSHPLIMQLMFDIFDMDISKRAYLRTPDLAAHVSKSCPFVSTNGAKIFTVNLGDNLSNT